MLVGVPKEIKNHEYRVGLTPSSVRELTAHGHAVLVERFGGAVPCGSEVITPAALFRAPELVTVDSVGAPPAIP